MIGSNGQRERLSADRLGSFPTMVIRHCPLLSVDLLRTHKSGVGFALIEPVGHRKSMHPAHSQECVP